MSLSELYESGIQKTNLNHFAAIVNIAAVDGQINEKEKKLLQRFANKLDINEVQYNEVIKNPLKYPIHPVHTKEQRLVHIYDLFRMIYSDHEIDEPEAKLVYKYAIGLGCSDERAKALIERSIKIFDGKIDFEDYKFLIDK